MGGVYQQVYHLFTELVMGLALLAEQLSYSQGQHRITAIYYMMCPLSFLLPP